MVTSPSQPATPSIELPSGTVAAKHIRGSSLLLLGQFIQIGLNFVSQMLLVRYLSTSDFGTWGLALSVVAFCQTIAPLGIDEALPRFLSIYSEKRQYRNVLGTILLACTVVLCTGGLVTFGVLFFPHHFAFLLHNSSQSLALLSIIVFLVPLQALDLMVMNLFACLARPRDIFFRRYVLAPVLKLIVIVALIASHAGIRFLAFGYIAITLLPFLIYSCILVKHAKRAGWFRELSLRGIGCLTREIFSYSLPLMTGELIAVVNTSFVVLLLGYSHNVAAVALYRVVLPAAALNNIVMGAFTMLYRPSASRLFAKSDYVAINDLYWRTATWMGVLTFPIFAATFCFARPLIILLYGERYAHSDIILALLSLGYYFNVVLGFNGLTLKVFGKVRYVTIINLAAAAVGVLLSFALIPHLGLLGAGIAASGSMICHNILKQAGLRLSTGIRLFDRQYRSFYLLIAGSVLFLLVMQWLIAPHRLVILFVLTGAISAFVLLVARRTLRISEVFPESRKIPVLGSLLA